MSLINSFYFPYFSPSYEINKCLQIDKFHFDILLSIILHNVKILSNLLNLNLFMFNSFFKKCKEWKNSLSCFSTRLDVYTYVCIYVCILLKWNRRIYVRASRVYPTIFLRLVLWETVVKSGELERRNAWNWASNAIRAFHRRRE